MPKIRETFRVLGRAVLFGLLDARQNLATVLVTTAIVASTLLVSSLALLSYRNVDSFIAKSLGAPQMVVYLAPDVDTAHSEEIAEALQKIPAVAAVRLVSAAEARSRLLAFFAEKSAGLDLEPGILPASLEVTLERGVGDVLQLTPMANRLREVAGVEEVEYVGQWTEETHHLAASVKHLMMFLSVLLLGISAVTTCLAQRLGCEKSIDHAGVLDLVGASRGLGRIAAATRGAIQGLSGAIVALGLCFVVYARLQKPVADLLAFSKDGGALRFLSFTDSLMILGAGAVIGILGGWWASRR